MELDASFFTQGVTARKGTPRITIRIVADETCPECGGEGSPKVCDENGDWNWKCYSSYDDCKTGYWIPGTTFRELKPTPERMAELAEESRLRVLHMTMNNRWISQGNCSRMIANDAPLPEGWNEGTGDL